MGRRPDFSIQKVKNRYLRIRPIFVISLKWNLKLSSAALLLLWLDAKKCVITFQKGGAREIQTFLLCWSNPWRSVQQCHNRSRLDFLEKWFPNVTRLQPRDAFFFWFQLDTFLISSVWLRFFKSPFLFYDLIFYRSDSIAGIQFYWLWESWMSFEIFYGCCRERKLSEFIFQGTF